MSGSIGTDQLLGLDQHGATFPTTVSLVATIEDLRADYCSPHRVLALMAASISNAAEIADVHGSLGLERITTEVARRALLHSGLQARLLRASPLGGFLVAVVVDRDVAHSQVDALAAHVRGLVDLGSDQVWPVVTVGAQLCEESDEIWEAVRDVRATVYAAGREAPGVTRWHHVAHRHGAREDLSLVRDLALALTDGSAQLTLAYQPMHDLRTRTVVGAEALLRWRHPTRGPVAPDVAVEAAERTGLITAVGRLVLDRALTQTNAWVAEFGADFRMHVNVSALELREPSYVDHLEAQLLRHRVSPANLLLEITETALVTDAPHVRSALFALRDLGVGIGIDDFGTGYSSIAHIQELPIDTVKVDRSLVSGIATQPREFTLTRAVLSLIGTLGVAIVAEGIESAVEAAHLQAMGCTLGQGYHLGRPVPPEQFAVVEQALAPVHALRPASA